MKRGVLCVALLLLMLLVLSGCQNNNDEGISFPTYAPGTQNPFPPQEPPQVPEDTEPDEEDESTTDWDAVLINPGAEEDGVGLSQLADVNTTVYPYAGATPMPLDPIDMPTPTPRPKLTFAYQTYEITSLGITFEGPIGWEVDETVPDTVILYQPEYSVLDNYRAFLMIEVRSTGQTLRESDMKSQVLSILDTLKTSNNYASWRPTNTAPRTLIAQAGVYADYRGVMQDDTIVRGRVHVASVNQNTITVHMSCPAGFNEDYLDGVYNKMRSTMKMVK